jgi:hypothetical protein
MAGMRITQTAGPGIYPECLKNILHIKGIPFTRVLHPGMGVGDNQEYLYQKTSQKSVPTMLWNDERPRNVWIEQLALAEEIGDGPRLIPEDWETRIKMFGLLNELLGIDGFLWNKVNLLPLPPPFLRDPIFTRMLMYLPPSAPLPPPSRYAATPLVSKHGQ